MGDYEPASSARQASADQMLAIAQVFEQQGKLDKAESMYRGALKKNRQNTKIRQHLADVQAKRPGGGAGTVVASATPSQQPEGATATIANAAAVNAIAPPAARAAVITTLAAAKAPAAVAVPATAVVPVPTATPSFEEAVKSVDASVSAAPSVSVAPVAVPVRSVSATQTPPVTVEAVLRAADAPETSSRLLVQALQHGESSEAKTLAATLLGDCPESDSVAREALEKLVADHNSRVDVLLAALDS